uniref:Zn-dependent hydrolase n=1 Tax=Fervidicoccus fontis TaxID=683846 RepID=A0A7J3ZK93_9CREN
MVLIKWHGHACFEVIDSRGRSIVFDPHDGTSIGISPPRAKADIVLSSHKHFDHDAVSVVAKPGAKTLVEKEGVFDVNGIRVEGFLTYHDKSMGALRGRNVVYKVEVDGLVLLHLGDLGHVVTEDLLEKLGSIDVLFVPVGGTFTIDAKEAVTVVESIRPRIAIPMHYKISGLRLPISGIEDFLARSKWPVVKVDKSEYEVTKESLPERDQTVVVVLRYR